MESYPYGKSAQSVKIISRGRVQEWLNWPVSKTGVPFTRYRGFESLPFRQVTTGSVWAASCAELVGEPHVAAFEVHLVFVLMMSPLPEPLTLAW